MRTDKKEQEGQAALLSSINPKSKLLFTTKIRLHILRKTLRRIAEEKYIYEVAMHFNDADNSDFIEYGKLLRKENRIKSIINRKLNSKSKN